MRHFTKLAAALAVAVPLMAASGVAQARDQVGFSVTIGTPNGYGYYGDSYYDNVRYRDRVLPPGVVRNSLRASYREVSRPERRGDVYIARAEDRRGRDLLITVNAYTGRVLDVRYARHDRDRWDDRDDRRNRHDDRHDRDGYWNRR